MQENVFFSEYNVIMLYWRRRNANIFFFSLCYVCNSSVLFSWAWCNVNALVSTQCWARIHVQL